MKRLDVGLLRQQIARAARRAFKDMLANHADESFYAFALYTPEDPVGVNPSANTEVGYDRKRARCAGDGSFTEADLVGNFRWSPYEWEYECVGAGYFDEVAEHVGRGSARYDTSPPLSFVEFKAGVFAAMALALSDLEFEGLFGVGPAREGVTVFCSIPNSGCTAWLEADSARRINPPEVFAKFLAERCEYCVEDADELTPDGNIIYDAYIEHLRREGYRA